MKWSLFQSIHLIKMQNIDIYIYIRKYAKYIRKLIIKILLRLVLLQWILKTYTYTLYTLYMYIIENILLYYILHVVIDKVI